MAASSPYIAVTVGDPAGIGPEIVLKALRADETFEHAAPVVFGDVTVLERARRDLDIPIEIVPVDTPRAGRCRAGTACVVDVPVVAGRALAYGEVQALAGKAAFEYIVAAVKAAQRGEVAGIATAPINKEAIKAAGVPFIGHTEMLGELTGSPDPLTMFTVRKMRIFFVTRHLSLAEACRQITRERVLRTLRLAHKFLVEAGVREPVLAVAGLNPHAGDGGLFGREEIEQIAPAIADACGEGIKAIGPVPADSVFNQAIEGRYDAVLSLYHDQGHIASKVYDFDRTVSATLGLPFIRTSVDHGTAFDIAGQGKARAVSMIEAIRVAGEFAALRVLR